jgi:Flp pilus assembly protein CpaB
MSLTKDTWAEVAVDVAEAKRLGNPSWVNARTTLGALLFLVALVGTQRVISANQQVTPVWSASRDIPAGTVLAAGDLVPTEVNLPADALSLYVLASTPTDSAVVVQSLRAGELVPLASLAASGSEVEGRLITIPIGVDHAVGGELRPGDRVDVFASFDSGSPRAVTRLLVADVEVIEPVRAGGLVSGGGSLIGLTLRVPTSEAASVAFAIRNAEIDIVRIAGAPGEMADDEVTAPGSGS